MGERTPELLIGDALPGWRDAAARQQLSLHTQLASATCLLNADAMLILLRNLMENVASVLKSVYVTQNENDHGSRVLWSDCPGNEKNWATLISFLDRLRYLD